MKISVIIPTMNRPDDLRAALESVMRQTRTPDEVIVVDQSTDPRSKLATVEVKRKYASRGADFRYVYREEKSTVKARNHGILLSTGDILAFIDDDVVLFNDYLEKVMRYFEEDPRVGGVMGNVVLDHQYHGWKWAMRKFLSRVFLINTFDGRMTATGLGYPIYEREIDRPMRVDLFSGYSMNFRREFLVDERFDEWFTGYSYREDVDLSYRISRRTELLMVPDARFFHKSSSLNRLNMEALKRMEVRNDYHVFRKYRYKNPLSNLLFAYSFAGILLIDLLEYVTTFDRLKLGKLRAGAASLVSVLLHGERTTARSA